MSECNTIWMLFFPSGFDLFPAFILFLHYFDKTEAKLMASTNERSFSVIFRTLQLLHCKSACLHFTSQISRMLRMHPLWMPKINVVVMQWQGSKARCKTPGHMVKIHYCMTPPWKKICTRWSVKTV